MIILPRAHHLTQSRYAIVLSACIVVYSFDRQVKFNSLLNTIIIHTQATLISRLTFIYTSVSASNVLLKHEQMDHPYLIITFVRLLKC